MELKIAIVGCGGISRAHVNALKQAGIPLVAGVDISEEARDKFAEANNVPTFADTAQMLDDVRPGAVILCTPPSVRIEPVKACLARNVAVLSEKPMAHTLADARKLAQLAKKAKVPCRVAYCHRFVPAVQRMRQIIEREELGPLILFRNIFGGSLPRMAQHWMSDPTVSGGGCLIDNSSHSIDLFTHLCGPADLKTVSALRRNTWPGRGEDTAFTLLRSTRGVTGQLAAGWLFGVSKAEIELIGESGAAQYDYSRQNELKVRVAGQTEWQIEKVEEAGVRFLRQIQAFQAALAGESTLQATFDEGLQVAQVVDAAMKG